MSVSFSVNNWIPLHIKKFSHPHKATFFVIGLLIAISALVVGSCAFANVFLLDRSLAFFLSIGIPFLTLFLVSALTSMRCYYVNKLGIISIKSHNKKAKDIIEKLRTTYLKKGFHNHTAQGKGGTAVHQIISQDAFARPHPKIHQRIINISGTENDNGDLIDHLCNQLSLEIDQFTNAQIPICLVCDYKNLRKPGETILHQELIVNFHAV